jgi:hypothetical protein
MIEGIETMEDAIIKADEWCGIQWKTGIRAIKEMAKEDVTQIGMRCMDDRFICIGIDGSDTKDGRKYVDIDSVMA